MIQSNQVVISLSGLEQEIHRLVNQDRKTYSLLQLFLDSDLSEIARKHSQDMANRKFFSHQTPEGKSPTDRAIAAGYTCRKNYGSYYTNGIA
ncbi:MAG: CAP domain-containing protein [Moorea sp. SIO1F2]|nr:CAP domain-containing protein [Moorena sp. SIO1F2]